MKPDWDRLGSEYASSSSVVIADVDCTVEQDLCGQYDVRGYPTIKCAPSSYQLIHHLCLRFLPPLFVQVLQPGDIRKGRRLLGRPLLRRSQVVRGGNLGGQMPPGGSLRLQ